MSRALQKAIVYELFAIFLAIVICAVALAETVAHGYYSGPWLVLVIPGLIALSGFLKALGASGDRLANDEDADDPGDGDRDGDSGNDDDSGTDGDSPDDQQSVAAVMGHPPY